MKLTKNNTHGGSHSIVNGTQKASEGKRNPIRSHCKGWLSCDKLLQLLENDLFLFVLQWFWNLTTNQPIWARKIFQDGYPQMCSKGVKPHFLNERETADCISIDLNFVWWICQEWKHWNSTQDRMKCWFFNCLVMKKGVVVSIQPLFEFECDLNTSFLLQHERQLKKRSARTIAFINGFGFLSIPLNEFEKKELADRFCWTSCCNAVLVSTHCTLSCVMFFFLAESVCGPMEGPRKMDERWNPCWVGKNNSKRKQSTTLIFVCSLDVIWFGFLWLSSRIDLNKTRCGKQKGILNQKCWLWRRSCEWRTTGRRVTG